MFDPKFGHFIQVLEQLSLQFESIVNIESDQVCMIFLHSHWYVKIIQNNISDTIKIFSETSIPPTIQGE